MIDDGHKVFVDMEGLSSIGWLVPLLGLLFVFALAISSCGSRSLQALDSGGPGLDGALDGATDAIWADRYPLDQTTVSNGWAVSSGGNLEDNGHGIAVDKEGNSYMTGVFEGKMAFGSKALVSTGDDDVFVAKLSPSGTPIWAFSAGGVFPDAGNSIALDMAGNSYVIGDYRNKAAFGSTTLTSQGNNDVFVAKLGYSGKLLWAVSAGGGDLDQGRGVAVDKKGDIYITGSYKGIATVGSTSLVSKGGWSDIFIAKMSSNGTFLWAISAGGVGWDHGEKIVTDDSGDCFITGRFEGTATFGPATLSSKGSNNTFVAKSSSNGEFLWAASVGGSSWNEGNGIVNDNGGNSYITGGYSGIATFGSIALTSKGADDVFAAKLSSSGTFLWAVSAGGSNSDVGNGITLDNTGNGYVTGSYQGTATFGSSVLITDELQSAFVAKLNSNGTFQWVLSAVGDYSCSSVGQGTGLDKKGNRYVIGSYFGTVTFGSSSLTSKGNDVFVWRIPANP